MAEVVELFPCLDDDEEEEEEEAEEGEEEKDESLYRSSSLIPIFTFGCLRFSSDSEESAITVSECSEVNTPLADDSFDDTPPSPLFNPFPETLDFRDFRAANEFGAVGNRLLGSSIESRSEDFRIVGFGSDSDSSERDSVIAAADLAPDDLGLRHSWGLIAADDVRGNSGEEFEWEEVDDRLDDRGVLGMMASIDNDETSNERVDIGDVQFFVAGETDEESEEDDLIDNDETSSGRGFIRDDQFFVAGETDGESEEDDLIDTRSNLVWEVLLAMNNHAMTRNNSGSTIEHVEYIPDFEDDREVFINHSDYEFQFGLLEHDPIIRGSPPAAKLVVESLPFAILTEEDVANNNCSCAICKDEFSLEEKAKQLPCLHIYHNVCILPWLGIRNTCPVCRYELPTDDPEYESLKGRI